MRSGLPRFIADYPELDRFFQDADYIDHKTITGEVGLREFIAGMLSFYPWWLVALYRLRGLLVRLLGLVKHEWDGRFPDLKPEEVSFTPGENASFFIVVAAREDTYWVSETPDDNHLQAFFGVRVEPLPDNRTRFHVFTLVRHLHWTGPVYFNLIRPFHHLVVRTMMIQGVSRGS